MIFSDQLNSNDEICPRATIGSFEENNFVWSLIRKINGRGFYEISVNTSNKVFIITVSIYSSVG